MHVQISSVQASPVHGLPVAEWRGTSHYWWQLHLIAQHSG